jgi:outer membrane receptor protein involved in Fe transport
MESHAQSFRQITGQVQDENNTPIPFASVALYSADSTMINGAVSDDEGKFALRAEPGQYRLKISFLSYEDKWIDPLSIEAQDVALGAIKLVSGSKVLESVVIEGEKSQMELHLDKRVFQVGKDLSNISGSATDILDNVPSVAVDVEGNVSLRGSQNVRILIDGRPSGLTGISTADALRQLQGNLIESVEVITNPSARYDAEGEVGIINIILKKKKKKGVNGSFSLNAGYPDNYGASFNINFRRNKLNFFSSYGISYRSNPGSGKTFSSFTQPDTAFYFRQENDRTRTDLSHNVRAGLDYFFNDQTILTGSFVIRSSEGDNTSRNEYRDFNVDNELEQTVIRREREEEPELNSELGLSFRRTYAEKDQVLTADFKWIENNETEYSRFTETTVETNDILYQRGENTEDERNALIQADYTHPFGAKGKFETGFKSTLRVINNDFRVDERTFENDWETKPELNNNMTYTENIHALYLIAGNEINKFSWQGGLRAELSDITVELEETNDKRYQNYINLFPSAHLSYKFTPDRTLQVSYSYRLSRPRFRDLMPFSNYSDIRSVSVGNPNLRPEYTHSIETGYLINWESGSLLSSAYYRYRTGVVQQITNEDSTGFTSTMPVNLAYQDAYGLEFNFAFNPVKWWRLNTNANFYRAITDGTYEGEHFFSDTYTWTSRTTSRITFAGNWDFQTGFNYRAPQITPQGRDRSMYFIDLGLSRDLFKSKGTVTFAVRDLLNTRRFRSIIDRETEDGSFHSNREFQWRARQFLLTFTYRLNLKKEAAMRENSNNNNEGEDF